MQIRRKKKSIQFYDIKKGRKWTPKWYWWEMSGLLTCMGPSPPGFVTGSGHLTLSPLGKRPLKAALRLRVHFHILKNKQQQVCFGLHIRNLICSTWTLIRVCQREKTYQDFYWQMNIRVTFGCWLSLCIFFMMCVPVIFAFVSQLTMCFPSPTSSSCPAGLHVSKLLREQ